MRNLKLLLILILSIFCIFGCSSKRVRVVKRGTIPGYDQTTIKKAFEAVFDNPKWTEEVTSNGTVFVEFTGNISKVFRRTISKDRDGTGSIMMALDSKLCEVGKEVTAQWTFASDRKSFRLSYINSDAFRGLDIPCILDMIYYGKM